MLQANLPVKIPHPTHPELTHCDTNHPYFSMENPNEKQIVQLNKYIDYVEEVGYAPDANFNKFINEVLIHNINDKYDNIIVVSAIEGTGKSTFEFWIGAALSVYLGFDFNVEEHFTYNLSDFNQLMKDQKFGYIGLDEGTKSLYKRTSQSALQTSTIKLLTQSRKRFNTTIICSPRFNDLDEYIRGHRVYINLRVIQRGYANVLIKKLDENEDPWSDDDSKLQRKAYPKGNKWYASPIWCPPIPKSVEEKYVKIADKNFQETIIEVEELSAPEKVGTGLPIFLREFESWDDVINWAQTQKQMYNKPFTFEQLEAILEYVSKKYELDLKASDSTIKGMYDIVKKVKIKV